MTGIDFDRVTARGLVKVFGATRALGGVDLTLEAGTTTVLEGPNGSGKSTLVGILSLAVRPTRGEVRFGPHAASKRGLRACLGVLAHAAMLYPDLSGRENLQLFASLHDIPNSKESIARTLARFEVGAWADRPVRTYSRGQLQRVALARAVLHAPRLLLLDEPSTGLDHASTERLVRATEEEKARGAIVVLVTHDAELAARLGDVRVRLERGRVVSPASSDEARA